MKSPLDSDSLARLRQLYEEGSKHSSYQVLSPLVSNLGLSQPPISQPRYERERFAFIEKHLDFTGKQVGDIGGNTGFFTFEALRKNAAYARYFEGNQAHARFVRECGELAGVEDRLCVSPGYFDFKKARGEGAAFDILFLLNVLHHCGDDYNQTVNTIEKIRESIVESLETLSHVTRTLVFQLGYCWKGDRNAPPLFANGSKGEQIALIESSLAAHWRIESIGIARKEGERVTYLPPDEEGLKRVDAWGEFLNRPLMILQSLHF